MLFRKPIWDDGLEPVVDFAEGELWAPWVCFGGGGGKKPPPPQPLPPPPTKNDADVEAEASAERKRRASQQGRASTILTGPEGAAGPASGVKTLLGQ